MRMYRRIGRRGLKKAVAHGKEEEGIGGNNQRVPWMKKELGYSFVFLLKIDILRLK